MSTNPHKRQEQVQALVEHWKQIMGLQGWDIVVSLNNDQDWTMNADIAIYGDRHGADLTISIEPEDEDERVVVHELGHIILHPLNVMVSQWGRFIPQEMKELFVQQWEDNEEEVINQFTRSIVAAVRFTLPKRRTSK
jgi:hypothetical protein